MSEEEREDHVDLMAWAVCLWQDRAESGHAVDADFYLSVAMAQADALLGRTAEGGEDDE